MRTKELSITGAFEVTPEVHPDERGAFFEWFRADDFERMTGHRFGLAQANASVSVAGALRGIHFAELPPGQAKYVTCVKGAVVVAVVDIRVGSPTFGQWETIDLDDADRKAVYVSEGLGHALIALEDGTVLNYLCSALHSPDREHSINPLDKAVGIVWPSKGRDGRTLTPLLSPRDKAAPGLLDLERDGLLPTYTQALAVVHGLREAAH